jgi:hypothetical protein
MPDSSEAYDNSFEPLAAGCQEIGETSHSDPIIEYTLTHLASPEVFERYISTQTRAERAELEQVTTSLNARAGKLAKLGLQVICASLIGESFATARKLGKNWSRYVSFAGKVVLQPDTGITLRDELNSHYANEVKFSESYTGDLARARSRLERAYNAAALPWQMLIDELKQRKDDPEFLEAAHAWANSWDSQRSTGPDGTFFNSGLIHFFEYRSDKVKGKRFRMIKEPMTVDGFIAFTRNAQEEIDAIFKPTTDPGHLKALLIDEEGNYRYYILQPNGHFIVAFWGYDNSRPLITSVTTEATPRYFNDVVYECLCEKDRGRVHHLGKNVRRII